MRPFENVRERNGPVADMYRSDRNSTSPATASGAGSDVDADLGDGAVRSVVRVPADYEHLAELRRAVASFVGDHDGDDDLAADFEILVSELATNVVRHTDEPHVEITLTVGPVDAPGAHPTDAPGRRRWTLDVSGSIPIDASDDVMPVAAQIDGRGLPLVDAIADAVEMRGDLLRCTLVR